MDFQKSSSNYTSRSRIRKTTASGNEGCAHLSLKCDILNTGVLKLFTLSRPFRCGIRWYSGACPKFPAETFWNRHMKSVAITTIMANIIDPSLTNGRCHSRSVKFVGRITQRLYHDRLESTRVERCLVFNQSGLIFSPIFFLIWKMWLRMEMRLYRRSNGLRSMWLVSESGFGT